MGKIRSFVTEFGMPLSFGNKTYKVVGAENTELTPDDLLFAANNDAFSFIALYHLGLYQNSTFIWLPTHSIEKFLKAYILTKPNYSEQKIRNISHEIKKLWAIYKQEYKFDEFDNIEEFIHEISEISPNVRYGDKSIALNDNLLSCFVFLLVHFNKYKCGSKNYPNSYYGFSENELSGFNYISGNYLKSTIKAYLHLIIEHQIVLSPTGICHPHKYFEVELLKQNRIDNSCPLCMKKVSLNHDYPCMTNHIAIQKITEYIRQKPLNDIDVRTE